MFLVVARRLLVLCGSLSSVKIHLYCSGLQFDATRIVNPLFGLLDPEIAHRVAVSAAARGWVPREKRQDPQILALELWGRKFSNPIGLAGGFDKNAEAVEGLLALGFGFIEVGSVTPIPQQGNPKPRIFRLCEQGAIVDRCGFNSEGIVVVAKRLSTRHVKRKLDGTSLSKPHPISSSDIDVKQGVCGIVGVNLGKNKASEDATSDYVQGVHALSQYADYLIQTARDEMQWGEGGPPPLLVKIAPDLSKQDLQDIAAVHIYTIHFSL
ncbi:Dihydroorotate dehydrogenase (quinone), mitochondrial, partial [Linum perenne]